MTVISMASPKGGTGKTTTTMILAGEIADAGGTVTIIDADPNHPFKFWADISKTTENITVHVCDETSVIPDEIEAAAKKTKFVLVDLEGVADMRMTEAIMQSDLVIIPTNPSPLDTRESVKLAMAIGRLEARMTGEIKHAVLFSRTSSVIQSRTFNNCIEILNEAGIAMFNSRVIERDAFKSMFSYGGTLHSLSKKHVPGLNPAKENAAAIIEEAIALLTQKTLKRDVVISAKANAA